MRYSKIKLYDIANGTGCRTSLFVSGCTHHCKGCFQPETWDFENGEPFTAKEERAILNSLEPYYVEGLTILGGEPFEPENQQTICNLLNNVRRRYGRSKDVWIYTGYLFDEDICNPNSKIYQPIVTKSIVELTDVIVDGEFVEEEKDVSLAFRGSRNQRIILVSDSLQSGKIVYWEGLYEDEI